MKNLFKRGYGEVYKKIEETEKAREMMGLKLFPFYLKKGEKEANIIFITDEPVLFEAYSIPANKGGKQFYEMILATPDCSYNDSDFNPQFKGAYLVYDLTEYEAKDGTTKESGLRLYTPGQTVMAQLDRIYTKFPPLLHRQITVVRSGVGKSTSYSFERGDVTELDENDIRKMIPEALKDEYTGTTESLMNMVENQLMMYVENYDSEEHEIRKNGVREKADTVIMSEEAPKPKLFSASKKKPKENQAKTLIAKKRGNK